jgi:tRNA-2-methylthio-N6-dimethylallyladenosine synthase
LTTVLDFLTPEAVIPAMRVSGKKHALHELAIQAARLTGQEERAIYETLLQRERLGSTGIGEGLAIPHGKLPKLGRLFGLLAKLDRPIDFEALDGQPVDILFLLLAPEDAGADHLKALARIARVLREPGLIERIRAARPDIAMSGDFIVGFPGERDGDFDKTLDLVREVGFASAFSFKYSRRPGTPASAMPGQVDEAVKAERLDRLNALLDDQQKAFNAAQVGRVLPVLFEKKGRNPGQIVGRSPYLQAVHAVGSDDLIGRIVPVRIESSAKMSLGGVLESQSQLESA